jgi:hypothetical protein
VRPPYGGHPRLFIWGLLEARLQKADLLILGGLNEGVWPAAAAPDPWLAPRIRAELGLPGLDYRVGLAAHDFASALGAPRVLLTRARRDSRSPTVASRFWLRLEAMTGGLARDHRLERLVVALDDAGPASPADRPEPCPPAAQRPRKISVTAVDRLKADPFAFYAQAILRLRSLDPVDADHSAKWKGIAVHEVLEQWLNEDECEPERLLPRAEALLAAETIHPMLRALWQPRLMEAIRWVEAQEIAACAGEKLLGPLVLVRAGLAPEAVAKLGQRPIFMGLRRAIDAVEPASLGDQAEQAQLQREAGIDGLLRRRLAGLVVDDGEAAAVQTIDTVGLAVEQDAADFGFAARFRRQRLAALGAVGDFLGFDPADRLHQPGLPQRP